MCVSEFAVCHGYVFFLVIAYCCSSSVQARYCQPNMTFTIAAKKPVPVQKEAAARCTPCDAYPLLNVVERPTTILSVSSSSHSMHHQQQSTLSHRHSITHACTASTAAGGCRSMRLEDMKLQDLDMVDTDPSDSSEGSHSPTLSSPARESADSGAFTAFFPGSGPPTNQEAVPVGVVFLHGVGVGIFPYLAFLWKVLASFRQDTPFIVPQVRHPVDID